MKKKTPRQLPLAVRAARRLRRLEKVRGLSPAEKSVHAIGLAATPEEQWQRLEDFARSNGWWRPSRPDGNASCGCGRAG
jgi:hypothetical protein